MPLPQCQPMPLRRLAQPFDHPDWIFEAKYDGFRALAYVDGDCRLVSRKGNVYRSFAALSKDLVRAVRTPAVLDGEIVCLDSEGRPQFYDLLWRRAEPYFYAFDLLWCDGCDLRERPLVERKRMLRDLVPPDSRLLYAAALPQRGIDLYRAACGMDLEGIVAKLAEGPYRPAATSWVKIKNPNYSQGDGRRELFERRRSALSGQNVAPDDSWKCMNSSNRPN